MNSDFTLYLSGALLGIPYAWIVLKAKLNPRRFL